MKNIEFYTTPHNEVEIKSTDGVITYARECKSITNELFATIESDYPQAFQALGKEYKRSADNPPFYKYLLVHRFLRCNCGKYDHIEDIDGNGTFHFERVECPLRGKECKLSGVVCAPKFNSKLSDQQLDIMDLFCNQNMACEDIAEQLNTSFDNIRSHIAKSYKKADVHSKGEFCEWAKLNGIFQHKML